MTTGLILTFPTPLSMPHQPVGISQSHSQSPRSGLRPPEPKAYPRPPFPFRQGWRSTALPATPVARREGPTVPLPYHLFSSSYALPHLFSSQYGTNKIEI